MARGTHRTLHRDEIEPVIDAWTSARPTAEIVELATALRIPVAEVGNGANLPHFDHLVDGGWFTDEPGTASCSRRCRTDSAVARRRARSASRPPLGRDTERHRAAAGDHAARRLRRVDRGVAARDDAPLPLAGIRVLDLTAFWAGPLIGYACAILGAEVIHVESTKQPDGIRLQHHPTDERAAVVGVVPDVPGLQHQQARPRGGARHRARARAVPRPRRAQRRA